MRSIHSRASAFETIHVTFAFRERALPIMKNFHKIFVLRQRTKTL